MESCKGLALGVVVGIVALYLVGDRWWLAFPLMAVIVAVFGIIDSYKANENPSGLEDKSQA